MPAPKSPPTLLPLRPTDFVLLAELQEGPRHGYALAQALPQRSEGQVTIRPGDLYRVLFRLSQQGLVVAHAAAGAEERRKTVYQLTELGRQVLHDEARRLAKLSAEVLSRPLGESS